MTWIPAIAVTSRNNNSCRSNKKGVIIGLIILLVLGTSFFFMFRFKSFNYLTTIPWMFITGFSVFLIFIVVIGAAAAKISSPKKQYNIKQEKTDQFQNDYQNQDHQLNPYIIQRSLQTQTSKSIYNENRKDMAIIKDTAIHFCRYCGAKMDRDEIFCHQCGSKL